MTRKIDSVIVIGSGAMGSGIAQVFAESGKSVFLQDVSLSNLQRASQAIESGLARRVKKGSITTEVADAAFARISIGTELSVAAIRAQLAIEVVFEQFEVKRSIITSLDSALGSDAIIASNTSSISITRLAAVSSHPQRVIGMHFFNPAPVMPLVEVVRGLQTSDATVDAVAHLARECGKIPVEANDSPGFVGNRILLPMINEAIFCLGERVADRNAIDSVMKLGMSHPMGPLALADLIGLDVCLDILEVLHRDFGDDKYRAAPLLRTMVAAGRLGRKSGYGFYHYAEGDLPV